VLLYSDLGTVKPVRIEGVLGILPKIKGGSLGLLNIHTVFGRLPVFSVFSARDPDKCL
jgi:hypothetical protein